MRPRSVRRPAIDDPFAQRAAMRQALDPNMFERSFLYVALADLDD